MHVSCYIEKDKFNANMSESAKVLSVDIQKNGIKEWTSRARPADCLPTSCGERLIE